VNKEIYLALRRVVSEYPGCEPELERICVCRDLIPWPEGLYWQDWLSQCSDILTPLEYDRIRMLMKKTFDDTQ
jgi:hypothetical protein